MQRQDLPQDTRILLPPGNSSTQTLSGPVGTIYSRDFSQRLQNSLSSGLSYSGNSLGFLRNSNSISKSGENKPNRNSLHKNGLDSETGSYFRRNEMVGSELEVPEKNELDRSAEFQDLGVLKIRGNNHLSGLFDASNKTIELQQKDKSRSRFVSKQTKNRTSIMGQELKSRLGNELSFGNNSDLFTGHHLRLGKRESHFGQMPRINQIFNSREFETNNQLKRVREQPIIEKNHPHLRTTIDTNPITNRIRNMDPQTFWKLFRQNFPELNLQDLTTNMNDLEGTELRPEVVENLADIKNYYIDPTTSNIFLKIGNQDLVSGPVYETKLVSMKNYLNTKKENPLKRKLKIKQSIVVYNYSMVT